MIINKNDHWKQATSGFSVLRRKVKSMLLRYGNKLAKSAKKLAKKKHAFCI